MEIIEFILDFLSVRKSADEKFNKKYGLPFLFLTLAIVFAIIILTQIKYLTYFRYPSIAIPFIIILALSVSFVTLFFFKKKTSYADFKFDTIYNVFNFIKHPIDINLSIYK